MPEVDAKKIKTTTAASFGKKDFSWSLSMFGTAVGAGVLFLPIRAGQAGFWPLVFIALLAGPMCYFAHLGMARFVLSSNNPASNITHAVEEHFGKIFGLMFTFCYVFAVYPILLIYGNAITNTVDGMIVHQIGAASPPRWLLSGVLIAAMISLLIFGQRFLLIVTKAFVYPLIIILLCLSIYLIPQWSMAALSPQQLPNIADATWVIYLTLPVLMFSFNQSPAISSMALANRLDYGEKLAQEKVKHILIRTTLMLLGFILFFVFSCVLALTPEQLLDAEQQNISILSYMANTFSNPVISILGPVITILAIFSSFFGVFLGAKEGLSGLVRKATPSLYIGLGEHRVNILIAVFIFLTTWVCAIFNPSILSMIETLGGPFIAVILFLLPMYAIRAVPSMRKFKGLWSNIFVTIMGVIIVSAVLLPLI